MDQDEFRHWYDSVAPDLRRYVARLCQGREESADVFQEAFARLLGSGFSTDDPVERRRYLFRIATNLVRDRGRWTRRWSLATLRERRGRSPEDGYADRVDVRRALAQLPTRSTALLWLAYVNGFSHHEIAEIVGVVPTSVRVLLARARKRLFENLERRDP